MKGNAVGWFEIYVGDIERAKLFYQAVFTTTLRRIETPETVAKENPSTELWGFTGDTDAYGAQGALVHMPGVPVGQNSVIVYFHCEDCAEEAQRAASAGGKIFRPKSSIGPFGFIALIHDPDGNLIGLHSMR